MAPPESMHSGTPYHFPIAGQAVECRLVRSAMARKLRIRVGINGIDVVLPTGRGEGEAIAFVRTHEDWVAEQLARVRRLKALRLPRKRSSGQMLYRGESVAVHVVQVENWQAPNRVTFEGGVITITQGPGRRTPATYSLVNWLRKQARERIEQLIEQLAPRVRRQPRRLYVMGQRTKWGNCSALGNLSINWRLILAPDHVLHYIVTHEMVHLAIPDHSQRFWLTVQSLCPHADRARQWLVANGHRLTADLREAIADG